MHIQDQIKKQKLTFFPIDRTILTPSFNEIGWLLLQ